MSEGGSSELHSRGELTACFSQLYILVAPARRGTAESFTPTDGAPVFNNGFWENSPGHGSHRFCSPREPVYAVVPSHVGCADCALSRQCPEMRSRKYSTNLTHSPTLPLPSGRMFCGLRPPCGLSYYFDTPPTVTAFAGGISLFFSHHRPRPRVMT